MLLSGEDRDDDRYEGTGQDAPNDKAEESEPAKEAHEAADAPKEDKEDKEEN